MDHKGLVFRIEWLGIVLITFGLYVQSFYDFIIRVMGAIMVVTGVLVLAFILGAKLGEGKIRYELYKKNSIFISNNSWRDSIRKLSSLGNGRH